jgi:hypothetical protein
MFVLSAPLNGMLMATGDGAKDCEIARASFWLPDRERSIIWRYLDGVSLALANMFRLHLGPEGASIWDRVWTGDRYRMEEERVRRATRRLAEFGLPQASFPGGSRLLTLDAAPVIPSCSLGEPTRHAQSLLGSIFPRRRFQMRCPALPKHRRCYAERTLNIFRSRPVASHI